VRLPWLAHDEAPGPYIMIPQYLFNKTKQHTHTHFIWAPMRGWVGDKLVGVWSFQRPCRPTLGQVDWFSWKTPLSQSHPVPPNLKTHLSQSHPVPPHVKTPLSQSHPGPPNMETPLSLSHLSHVLQPVPMSRNTRGI